MSDENLREIYKTFQASQDKYTYFQLAASMTAIGFTITQTKTLALSITQLPLGLCVLCWSLSFLFGMLNRAYCTSTLSVNAGYLKMKAGQIPDPKYGIHPQYIQAASEGIMEAMESNSKKASRLGHLQTWLLYFGAVFYMSWHVYEMYLRI